MTNTAEVLDDAMELSPPERARLVNELLTSLNHPDEEIDQKWKQEVQDRIKAVDEGDIGTVSLDDVLSKYQD